MKYLETITPAVIVGAVLTVDSLAIAANPITGLVGLWYFFLLPASKKK